MPSRLDITLNLLRILACFLEQSQHRIRPDITLDELGADSFDVVELQAVIEENFAIHISQAIHTYTTFAELVDLVFSAMSSPPVPPH
ncbi:acyl carrier protein [Pseudomonas xantholysinigenes]|uniref:Carrier domain-containing protein n=1 Tax=Pseudomonas xantholysinigenes TaxID=2745490 RepID=A0A9E6PZ98_9PSED|nr:phosphopantetheine-binding protein [Pseudomonas xantholysinigenes]QXI40217.1 hypothetical protein HU772_009160 [Pseudomonas xantholysinigenes]